MELVRRNTCKVKQALSNFSEKFRICLTYYLNIEDVCNQIQTIVFRVKPKPPDLQKDIFWKNSTLFQ